MPRDGSFIYSIPPGTEGVPETTIESTKYNTFIHDVETDLNAPRPIVAGGTGATNAAQARDNLDAEVSGQTVTNYNSHVFENGSFSSDPGATGAPLPGRYFVGISTALTSDPTNNITLQATTSDAIMPATTYTRQKVSGVWGAWRVSGLSTTGGANYYGNEIADMSFGLSGAAPTSQFFVNSESDVSGTNYFYVSKGGAVSLNAAVAANNDLYFSNANVPRFLLRSNGGTNMTLTAFNDAGAAIGNAFSIDRATFHIATSEPAAASHVATKNYVDTTTVTLAGGGTVNGNIAITNSDPFLSLNKTAANSNNLLGQHGGVSLWSVVLGNVSSNFRVVRFSGGAPLDAPLEITFADGLPRMPNGLVLEGLHPVGPYGSKVYIGHDGNSCAITTRPTLDPTYPFAFFNSTGTCVGTVYTTTTGTAYNTTSDERLKEDLKPFTTAGTIIDNTQVYDFRWKSSQERAYGVIAQQAAIAYPAAVVHDTVHDAWWVDYSKYVPVLLQEAQSLRQTVADLKARIARLEAAATP